MAGFGFGGLGSAVASPANMSLRDKLLATALILKGDTQAAAQLPMLALQRQMYQDYLGADTSAPGTVKPPTTGVRTSTDVQPGTINGAPLPKLQSDLGNVSIPQLGVKPALADVPPEAFAPENTAPTAPPTRPASASLLIDPSDPASMRRFKILSLINPQAAGALARAAQATRPEIAIGPDGTPYNKYDPSVLSRRFAHPDAINNTVVDLNDPENVNRVIPSAPVPGAMPVYDNRGRVVDWTLPSGAAGAIAASESAKASGQKGVEARYAGPIAEATAAGKAAGENPNTLETHDLNGVPTTMTRQQWLQLSGGGSPAPEAPGGDETAPRGVRNNNFGNLKPLAQGAWAGQVGVDPSGYVQFATPEAGVAAAEKNLIAKQSLHGLNTVQQIIADPKWGWDPGNTSYAGTVASQLGVKPDQPVNLADPATRQQMLSAIFSVENGRAIKNNAGMQATAPAASPQAGRPGFHGVNAKDAERVAALEDDAHTAEDVVQKAHQFQDLNKAQASGPGYRPFHIPIPILRDVDLNIPGAIARQYQTGVPAMENLSMQIAAGLRAPGQRLTQAEIMTNLNRVPGINNLPAQNDKLVGDIEQRAALKRAYANFMQKWLADHGSLAGADEAWSAQQSGDQTPSAPQGKIRTYNPATGQLE